MSGAGQEILLFTKRLCGGCEELRARLEAAGIPFVEYSADEYEGLALAMWYEIDVFPAVVRDPEVLSEAQVEALLEGGES